MTETGEQAARRWTLGLASVASLMVALDAVVVATALSEIGREFDASIEALEWTVNGYLLSFAVLLLTAAALGDRFGRRRLFTAGLAVFTIASGACALAPGVEWLIAARIVQGVGAAMIMPLALALVGAAFPPERRNWALGIYSAVTALSTIVGPVFGGIVTQGLAWQWIFWLNVPIGTVAAVLALGRLRESFGPRVQLDLRGLALATLAAFALVWGLVRANAAGWGSAETLVSLIGGLALVAAFVRCELRAREPMMPMRLFGLRAFAAGNAAMFLLYGAAMGAIFFMAQFQQAVLGCNPLDAALRMLPWGIALTVVAPKTGMLAERLGERSTIVFGLAAQAIGFAWFALVGKPGAAYAEMVVPMVLAGIGFAMAIPIVQKLVVGAVAPADIGKASGTLSTTRQLGGAFGLALAVAAFAAAGSHATPQAFGHGFAAASLVSALLSAAGAAAALALPGRRHAALAQAKAGA